MTYRGSVNPNGLEDPVTMMSGSATKAGTSDDGKKKKKKKLTAAERAQAKVEKSAEDLRRSGAKFDYFLDRMEIWLKKNKIQLIELFRTLDMEGEGAVTYDEFKACLFDLGSPCNKVETQLLCTLLDPNHQEAIEYGKIESSIEIIRDIELTYEREDYRPTIEPTPRTFNHCPKCKLSMWDGVSQSMPRYVLLELRLVTFDGTKEHPGHVKLHTHTHISIKGIMDYIKQETSLLSSKLAVFKDKSRSVSSMLSSEKTLDDLGMEGGPAHQPQLATMYYDYVVEFTDCPLLMCDHYFGGDRG